MDELKSLVDLVYWPRTQWTDVAVRTSIATALRERYARVADVTAKRNDERKFQLRVNAQTDKDGIPYAALIPAEQEESGPYGGMSFVVFPADADGPSLVGMVVGTNGLAPDEEILGRPGHARKCAAIASWLNTRSDQCAWAKRDPTRIDRDLPNALEDRLEQWSSACGRYGKFLYMVFRVPGGRSDSGDQVVADGLAALIDLFMGVRGFKVKKDFEQSAEKSDGRGSPG